jgi:hypothetical protein
MTNMLEFVKIIVYSPRTQTSKQNRVYKKVREIKREILKKQKSKNELEELQQWIIPEELPSKFKDYLRFWNLRLASIEKSKGV